MKPACIYRLFLAILFSITTQANEAPRNDGQWIPLPVIGNSPETGFEYGAYMMRIAPAKASMTSQSRFEYLASATTKGLFQSYFWPKVYMSDDWLLKGTLGGRYWPGTFYGISNVYDSEAPTEQFESTRFEAHLWSEHRYSANIWFGAGVELISEDIKAKENQSVLTGDVTGFEGGFYTGLGANASYQQLDSSDYPTQGAYAQHQSTYYWTEPGESGFYKAIFDGRMFSPVSDQLTLGNAARLELSSEHTPFQMLSAPSGSSLLRGADSAKYIDRHMLTLQSDLRYVVNQRLGFAAFIDMAQVNSSIDFSPDDFHIAVGGGLRYNTMAQDRLNIRFDLGLVDGQHPGLIITLGEAF